MKLAFKNKWSSGYTEKDVPILLNFGTLEPICQDLEIEFYQMDEYMKKHSFDFMCALLFYGYVSACKESYQKPKYTKVQSIYWYDHISKESEEELKKLLTEFSGKLQKTSKPVSKKKVN